MILITGANGFIGHALCDEFDQRKISFRPASRLPRDRHITIGEISENTDWQTALAGIETVIHLAARVHVMEDSAASALAAFRAVNVDATLSLASQSVAAGVKRFIFISSIKVNGVETRNGQPFTADDDPNPQDPYGQSKFEAEQALVRLAKETSLEVTIIRPPLVYGPGVKANFRMMVRWIKRGLPLPFGAVNNKRSFVFVRNLTDLIVLCTTHPAAANQVFLVSDGKDISTPDLLLCLAKALNCKPRLVHIPPRALTFLAALVGKRAMAQRLISSLQIDIGKTQSLLGWQAPVTLTQGLEKTAIGSGNT